LTILATILVFGVLVTVHELGHFVTAKLTGMRVDEFAIGFGPKIFQTKSGDTLYSLRAIPLGGFNKIAGMDPDDKVDEKGFNSKPILSRMLVILAGSFMNFVLPIVLFFMIFLISGVDTPVNEPVIGQVFPKMPAVEAGLMPGDKIVSLNSHKIKNWDEIVKIFKDAKENSVSVEVERAGALRTYVVVPKYQKEMDRTLVGISPKYVKEPLGVFEAAQLSVSHTKNTIVMMVDGLYKIISGKSPAEVAGPIGVAQMAGKIAQDGFLPLLTFIAFLSINLGVVNLLPLPALDGGYFILLVLEAFRKKTLPASVLEKIQIVGIALILIITVFSTFKDLTR
jgi:regulator of sigma E protease